MGMYPSLMGTFSCVAPVIMIGSSLVKASTSLSSIPFCTSQTKDRCTIPSLSVLREVSIPIEMDMLFPTTMVAYQANLDSVVESNPSSS